MSGQCELFAVFLAQPWAGFVTLTTLGYGDSTPARPETMSLATLEAVVGKLYLVVMVAAFVGRRGDRATGPDSNLSNRESANSTKSPSRD